MFCCIDKYVNCCRGSGVFVGRDDVVVVVVLMVGGGNGVDGNNSIDFRLRRF